MKTYSWRKLSWYFETGLGFHNSDINPSTADALPNDKRNLDAFISYSVDYTFKGITLTPKYKFTYRDYQYNAYKDRHDLVHALQLTCFTHITEFLKLSLSFDYINQDDSQGESSYENYDIGGNINLMARF